MARSYAETYALCCASLIEAVQKRLGRDLTPGEWRSIWNIGTLMMFESVERDLEAAPSAAELAEKLHSMEAWTEDRFRHALANLLKLLPEWLDRPVSDAERAALAHSEHLGIFLSLAARLPAAPPEQREAVLREATEPPAGQSRMPPAEELLQP